MDTNLETTCDALYEMACDVNDALYYQYHASMEEQYQSAYSYELKKKKYVFHSESVIQLLYKEFPLRETEAIARNEDVLYYREDEFNRGRPNNVGTMILLIDFARNLDFRHGESREEWFRFTKRFGINPIKNDEIYCYLWV